ncbi:hypothetical protein JXA47_00405 [Candidatus Sumerlaeota bacterium]|nr:hypothetical protein [Candidatus Sumerlaeota bacterium]
MSISGGSSRRWATWILITTVALATVGLGATPTQVAGQLAPQDSAVILAVPNADMFFSGILGFMAAFGEGEGESASTALADMSNLQVREATEAGINVAGDVVLIVASDMDTTIALLPLADTAAFQRVASEGALSTGQVQGLTTWTRGWQMPDGTVDVDGVYAVMGDVGIVAPSEQVLQMILSPHAGPRILEGAQLPGADSGVVLIDIATIINAHRQDIEQGLQMFQMMAGGMGGPTAGMINMYTGMFREMLNIGGQAEALSVIVTPSAQAMVLNADLRFQPGAPVLASLPRHVARDLTLNQNLPSGAIMRFDTTFDAERSGELMGLFTNIMGGAMAADPSGQAALNEIMGQTTAFYRGLGDEIAFGMYPGQGMMPGIVMAMRAPDPQTSLQQWVGMCASPAFRQLMASMYGISPDVLRFEDLGTQMVGSAQAQHIRLSGMAAMMQQMMGMQPGMQPPPQMQQMMEAMDSIDYWFASTGELAIMTTEAQPTLLAQALAGGGPALEPPAMAGLMAVGADSIGHLSLSGLLGWVDSMSAMMGMPPGASPLGAMAQSLSRQGEVGIWCAGAMHERGLRGGLLIPASDIAAIVQGAQQAMSQSMGQPMAPPQQPLPY